MAALMFQVPPDISRVLGEIPVPGVPEKHDSHVTVVHLGKDISIIRISELLPVLYEVTVKEPPFSVSTKRVSTFSGGDDGVPVIALIESPELHAFRNKLCKAMDSAGIEYDTKFKDYRPHTTLAYASDPKTKFDMEITEVSWGVSELLLWGSNRGTGRLVVKFPLSLPGTAKNADTLKRACVQLAVWSQTDDKV